MSLLNCRPSLEPLKAGGGVAGRRRHSRGVTAGKPRLSAKHGNRENSSPQPRASRRTATPPPAWRQIKVTRVFCLLPVSIDCQKLST